VTWMIRRVPVKCSPRKTIDENPVIARIANNKSVAR